MKLISLKDIVKVYEDGKNGKVKALSGVNLKICEGEAVAIMGVSGSGKSTLLHMIGCLDTPTSGEYLLQEKNICSLGDAELSKLRNKQFGFILQDHGLLMSDTVYDNVVIPLHLAKEKLTQKKPLMVMKVLADVGLKDVAYRKVCNLSGGQRQRVGIARAIVNNPQIILADEPTASLDFNTANEIMNILLSLSMQGKTIIMVTHDINMAQRMNRIIKIKDGIIVN